MKLPLTHRARRTSLFAAAKASSRCLLEQLENRQLLAAQLAITDTLNVETDKTLDFAATDVSATAGEETFTITNSGDAALEISNFIECGANADDFDYTILDSGGNPLAEDALSIAAGDYITIGVEFSPNAIGERIAHLSFNTNDPTTGHGALSLNLTGSGVDSPDAPTDVQATVDSSSQITLGWTDVAADETGYKIYQATSADGPFALVNTIAADSTSFAVTGLRGYTHYYFQVKAYSAGGQSTAGTADASTTAAADPAPNDSATTPYNIGTLNGPRTYRNFVGAADQRDYYKVRMSAAGKLRVSVGEMTAAVAVTVFKVNTNGSLTTLATRTLSTSTSFNATVSGAGYYLVRIANSGGSNTNYRLTLTPDYAGETRALARNIGALTSTTRTFYDTIGVTDGHDYYKFTLGSTKTVRLALTQLGIDADIEILNSSGVRVAASENGDTADETITKSLAAGTYYIHISAWEPAADTSYRLAVSAS